MTSEQVKKIEEVVKEAENKEKKSHLYDGEFLKNKFKNIMAYEETVYTKLAKTRKIASAVVGGASAFFTGYEFMEMYNLFYDASLYSLYNQNTADINQMKVDLLSAGVPPEEIHVPVFSDVVKEQLADFGIDASASSSDVILNAMSKGVFDFSTLDPAMGVTVAALVGLSGLFAGFEVNNFLKNRIRESEVKKMAQNEGIDLTQSKEEQKTQQPETKTQQESKEKPENKEQEKTKEEEFNL